MAWASHSATPIPKDLVPEVPIISTPETSHFLFSWTQHRGGRVLFGCSLFPDGGGRVGKMIYAGWMEHFDRIAPILSYLPSCHLKTLRNWHPNCKAGLPNSCFHRKWRDLAAIFGIQIWICASHTTLVEKGHFEKPAHHVQVLIYILLRTSFWNCNRTKSRATWTDFDEWLPPLRPWSSGSSALSRLGGKEINTIRRSAHETIILTWQSTESWDLLVAKVYSNCEDISTNIGRNAMSHWQEVNIMITCGTPL